MSVTVTLFQGGRRVGRLTATGDKERLDDLAGKILDEVAKRLQGAGDK